MGLALISGGTRGIGLAVALSLKNKGYKTVVCYSKDQAAALNAQNLGLEAIKCDVSNPDSVKALSERIEKLYGGVDVLVNCAGVSLEQKVVLDVTLEEFNHLFDVNVKGTFLLTNAIIPLMLEKGGSIINISSIWGIDGGACEAVYSATKGAINAYTKALSKELAGANIRVNAVAPGYIDTQMNAHISEEDKLEFVSNLLIKRVGTGEDVANAVTFLIENDYITGQILRVDGGMI